MGIKRDKIIKKLKHGYLLPIVIIILFIVFTALFFALHLKNVSMPIPFKASSKTSDKTVFLTFDADMTPYMKKEQKSGLVKQWYDPTLIDYLEKNNIQATFFVTGMFAEMYPDLIKHLAANPNFSIQNHTYDHSAFEPHCFHLSFIVSDQEKQTEIKKTQSILKSITGKTPTYFRYPGLCHNAHDDTLVAADGLLLVHGEFNSGDAYMRKPELIVRNIFNNLKRGNVIIFHLGTKKSPATTDAVKLLIPKLKKSGYIFSHL